MKNRFILLLIPTCISSCNAFRPATRSTDNLSEQTTEKSQGKNSQPVFIKSISTEPAGTPAKPKEAAAARYNSAKVENSPKTQETVIRSDDFDPLQYKYAILTNTPVEELTNQRLLLFIEQWYGAPYHYGGNSRDGIDCSAFVSLLLTSVYNVNQLPRSSADQFKATRRISKKDLREGDLVFFHTLGKGHQVTHVGVFLYNNRFVHASIAGVQISDLGEGYYLHHYVGAGRVVESDRTY
jgi:cell wall-associated NlpC family hydrolase